MLTKKEFLIAAEKVKKPKNVEASHWEAVKKELSLLELAPVAGQCYLLTSYMISLFELKMGLKRERLSFPNNPHSLLMFEEKKEGIVHVYASTHIIPSHAIMDFSGSDLSVSTLKLYSAEGGRLPRERRMIYIFQGSYTYEEIDECRKNIQEISQEGMTETLVIGTRLYTRAKDPSNISKVHKKIKEKREQAEEIGLSLEEMEKRLKHLYGHKILSFSRKEIQRGEGEQHYEYTIETTELSVIPYEHLTKKHPVGNYLIIIENAEDLRTLHVKIGTEANALKTDSEGEYYIHPFVSPEGTYCQEHTRASTGESVEFVFGDTICCGAEQGRFEDTLFFKNVFRAFCYLLEIIDQKSYGQEPFFQWYRALKYRGYDGICYNCQQERKTCSCVTCPRCHNTSNFACSVCSQCRGCCQCYTCSGIERIHIVHSGVSRIRVSTRDTHDRSSHTFCLDCFEEVLKGKTSQNIELKRAKDFTKEGVAVPKKEEKKDKKDIPTDLQEYMNYVKDFERAVNKEEAEEAQEQ